MRLAFCALGILSLISIGGTGYPESRCEAIFKTVKRMKGQGDYRGALVQADKGLRDCEDQNENSILLRFAVSKADSLNRLGKYTEAQDALKQEPPADPKFADVRSTRKMQQSWSAFQTGDYRSAELLLADAEREAHLAGVESTKLLGDVAVRQIYLFARERKVDEAREFVEKLMARNPSIEQDELRSAYGYLFVRNGRYEEAVRELEAALPGYLAKGNAPRTANLLSNIGTAYYHLGDTDRALRSLLRAEPLLRGAGSNVALRICLNSIGTSYLDQQKFKEANVYLQESLNIAKDLKDAKAQGEVLNNLALVAIAAKDWDKAEEYNRLALALKRANQEPGAEAYSLVNDAQIRIGRRDFSGALATLDSIQKLDTVDRTTRIDAETEYLGVYRQLHDRPNAFLHYQRALALAESERSQMVRNESKLSWTGNKHSAHQEWVRFLVEANQAGEALEAAERTRARLLLEHLGRSTRSVARETSVGALQRTARLRNAALISYWLMPDISYAWVVRPEGVTLCPLPGEQTITRLVTAYQGFLEDEGDPLHSGNVLGGRLREAVLDPVLPYLRGMKSVVIVPDGALHALNFETLPVHGGYWVDDVTVSVAPCLSLIAEAPLPADINRATVLAIGDAEPTPNFPRLPSASRELRTIATLFPRSRILQGKDATPAAYLAASDSQEYIHFAAHASASSERPLDSAVILSPGSGDGRLTAHALLNKPMNAKMVTISACRSAGARSYHGEGLVGFAWVFLQTGAHSVIAGLWDASDDATARLMSSLYQRIANGQPPPDALRGAKLELAHGDTHLARPYFWAPFQYFIGR